MPWNGDKQRDGRRQEERHYGKYAGSVVDNGPPTSGAHRGEVVVTVPGILEETPDGSGNQPIKVLAAPAFLPGYFFVPEQDDRVWVEFVDGDLNYPIWTGVWYPQDATPNTTDSAAPTRDQKIIRTKSGLVVQLDDTSGSEQLVIKDEKNSNTITLDKNGVGINAASGANVTLTVGQSTVVVENNDITLTSGAARIKMGSTGTTVADTTGSDQAVVLKPFSDWFTQQFLVWALTHTHVGNMGAPTSPPAAPPPPPSPAMPNPAASISSSG